MKPTIKLVCKPIGLPLTTEKAKLAQGLYGNGDGFSLEWIAWFLDTSIVQVVEVVK